MLSAALWEGTKSSQAGSVSQPGVSPWRDVFFTAVVTLGIAERLSRLANLLSIERDWVPTLALPASGSTTQSYFSLTHLNAMMSRIDLVCKLGSPILVSLLVARTSATVAVFSMLASNILSWPLEFWTARAVWNASPALRIAKEATKSSERIPEDVERSSRGRSYQTPSAISRIRTVWLVSFYKWIMEYGSRLHEFFATEIYIPSLATSSLDFSILNYSSTLIVFLLHSHFPLNFVILAETLSAFFELSSTFVFPWAVYTLSSRTKNYASVPGESSFSTAISLSPTAHLTSLPSSPTDSTFPRGLPRSSMSLSSTGHLRSLPSSPVESRFPRGLPRTSTSDDGQEDGLVQQPELVENVSSGLSRLGLLALFQMLLCLVSIES